MIAALCAASANAATYTWTGGGDNATFTDMQNWGQAAGASFDTSGSYTFPSTTTASAIAFPSGSTQVYGTITFNSGCPAITFSGGKITKVVKVVNNSSNNMTFNNAVTFNGNIDIRQTARWNENSKAAWTLPNGRVIFWGGATGTNWTRYNGNENILSGHCILTTESNFNASTGNADRTIIAPNSSLTVKNSDQIQELYLMSGASFIVTSSASHGWGDSNASHRLWCWNNGGTFIALNGYSLTNSGKQWLGGYRGDSPSCTLNKNWKIITKSIRATKTGGTICLHSHSNNSGTDYSDIYIGSGGIACTGTACVQVENSSHPTTLHPIDSNFTIARGGNGTGDLQLGNGTSSGATQLTLATDDTNGVPRTVSLVGLLSSTTTTAKFIVSGHGTNSVSSASDSMTGTYTVSSGATAVFGSGKGFQNATVSVANGGRLVAGGSAAKAGKLKVANGSTLEFKLSDATCTSFAATSVTPAASGAKAAIAFTPGSVKTFGPSYALITGASIADVSNYALPENDAGRLVACSGALYYIAIAPRGEHDYIWTGEGDGVTFNDMANWGGSAGDAFDESGTYMFAAGSPANVEVASPISAKAIYFAAGCPAVTIGGEEIVSIDSITCQNGYANEFQNAVAFSDMINVTASNGYAKFTGGATGTQPTLHYEYYGIYKCTTSTTWQPSKATTIKSGSEFYVQNYCGGTGTVTIESGAYMCVTNAYAGNAQRIVYWNNGVFEALGNIVFNATSTADADRPKFSVNELDAGMYIANGIVNSGNGIVYFNAYKEQELPISKRYVVGSGGISGKTAIYYGNSSWRYPIASKADWEMAGAGFGQWTSSTTGLLMFYTYSERFGYNGRRIRISAPITGNAKVNVYAGGGNYPYDGRIGGILEFNAVCAFSGGLEVKDKSSVAIRSGKQAGTGTITVRDASSLIFPDTGTVTLAGPLTLEANSTLEFKVAKAANAVLNRNSKTLTLPDSGKVKVKLTADSDPVVAQSYTLTSGAGLSNADKFELADGVRGTLTVVSGELVYTPPPYFVIKVK